MHQIILNLSALLHVEATLDPSKKVREKPKTETKHPQLLVHLEKLSS